MTTAKADEPTAWLFSPFLFSPKAILSLDADVLRLFVLRSTIVPAQTVSQVRDSSAELLSWVMDFSAGQISLTCGRDCALMGALIPLRFD